MLKETYEHSLRLRKEMEAWIDQSRLMDPPSRYGGGEDEANYALAWFPHYLVTQSASVGEHFVKLRDLLSGWVDREFPIKSHGQDCPHKAQMGHGV